MNINKFAPTPPMGWNSYDYYDTTVNKILKPRYYPMVQSFMQLQN
jgi:hypothetical protein